MGQMKKKRKMQIIVLDLLTFIISHNVRLRWNVEVFPIVTDFLILFKYLETIKFALEKRKKFKSWVYEPTLTTLKSPKTWISIADSVSL